MRKQKINVRKLRESFGEDEYQFAVRLGCTPETVRNWESGKSRPSRLGRMALGRLVEVSGDHPGSTEK